MAILWALKEQETLAYELCEKALLGSEREYVLPDLYTIDGSKGI